MNLNFDYQFDVYKFFEVGFNVGILPNDLTEDAKQIIAETTFKNFIEENQKTIENKTNQNLTEEDLKKGPIAASWSQMPLDTLTNIISPNNKKVYTVNDFPYEEQLRDMYCFDNAPDSVKELAIKVLDMPFFDPLKLSLVKDGMTQNTWLRSIKSFTYGLWNGTEDLPWHNDSDDCCNMIVLMYFNDYPEWKPEWNGQICFGKEKEDETVKEIHQHYPTDGTFVCINNYNPLMRHKTIANDYAKNRYTFSFKFKFE
jgi:hypothetical protein